MYCVADVASTVHTIRTLCTTSKLFVLYAFFVLCKSNARVPVVAGHAGCAVNGARARGGRGRDARRAGHCAVRGTVGALLAE